MYALDRTRLFGKELEIEFAQGDRKTPMEMRGKERTRRPRSPHYSGRYDDYRGSRRRSRSPYYRDRSPGYSRRRSRYSGSRSRSRSYSRSRDRRRSRSPRRSKSYSRSGSQSPLQNHHGNDHKSKKNDHSPDNRGEENSPIKDEDE